MADIKFSCPHCQQHIEAGEGYAGMQINCPTCKGGFIVPGRAAAVAVAPAPPTRPPPTAPPPLSLPKVLATAQPQLQTAPPASSAAGCPSCGSALPRGAVLCTNCGYNLSTGQRMVAGQVVAPGKPSATQWETPWYKTPWPYLGLLALVLGIFYLLGRENPAMMLAFVGTAVLYSLTIHIIVIVAAFREGVGSGFLTMCIPFYSLYFVFKVNDNDTLKVLYGVAAIINLALRLIPDPA